MKTPILLLLATTAVVCSLPLAAQEAATRLDAAACARLATLTLPETTITGTELVEGPSFTPPNGRALDALPSFCRVSARSKPAVNFEVWLPLATWNGKFQGVGNGANAGSISYNDMAPALRRGYAVASTDTGHATDNARDATWAVGHPELMEDFGHRAIHLMTVHGKAVVTAFYSQPARWSYYASCSTGGRQGMMEAQRYPEDYDGLVLGAPANNWTHFQMGGHLWAALATVKTADSYIPTSKLPLIANAVNAACDALDGVTDGVLEDPRRCTFAAQELACAAGQNPETCLTPGQVTAVTDIWTGPYDSRGEQIYPPYTRGAEDAPGGWERYTTGTGPLTGTHWVQGESTVKYMMMEDLAWDYRNFDYERDLPYADAKLGATMNAFDPDLSALRKRGGRVLLYHGWNDPSISPLNTIDYYEQAVATWRAQENMPADAEPDFIRLFMVPGMLHCGGGPGTSEFDALTALERWVEQGEAPATIPAAHEENGVVTRTRPLCAYPQVAVYSGQGSTDSAENFSCEAPR